MGEWLSTRVGGWASESRSEQARGGGKEQGRGKCMGVSVEGGGESGVCDPKCKSGLS